MMTRRQSDFERRIQWPLRRGLALGLLGAALAFAGCGAPSGVNEEPRYPEKRRPAPLRSASDGEVMGSSGQPPENTLEASPTNLHAAPGWEGEHGAMERAKEADCDPEAPRARTASAANAAAPNAAAPNASTTKGRPRSARPCPKPVAP
jgi:hypothetical protein